MSGFYLKKNKIYICQKSLCVKNTLRFWLKTIMNRKISILGRKGLMMIILSLAYASYSQTNISGTISDNFTKEPLVGAYVLPINGQGGAISDLDGKFTLEINESVKQFKVTFVGYTPQTIDISNQTKFQILLVSEDKLDEVLVIAYGTQKKSDKTGAVTQVTSKELNKGRITDPIQGMQGKAAGVNISKQGGDPNGAFSVNIRGAASITGGTGPLYVVDGVVGIDPTTLNPDDIESFNILKDAASTSLYGTQGSNGVIIITTKGGSFGGRISDQIKVEYNNFISFDKVANRLDFLTGNQLRQYADDVNSQNFSDNGANTDWMDEIYRTGISHQHTLAFSKSDENTSYRASISTNNLIGVIKGSSRDRYIARLNISQKALNDKLTLTARLSGTIQKSDFIQYGGGSSPDNVIYQAMRRSPTDPVFNPDGTYYESDRSFQYNNPVALIEQTQNEQDAKKLLGNFDASYAISDHLTAQINTAYARDDNQSFYAQPASAFSNTTNGLAARSYNNKNYKYVSEILNYNNSFNKKHNLNLIGGHSLQSVSYDGFRAEARNIDPFYEDVQSNNLQAYSQIEWGYVS